MVSLAFLRWKRVFCRAAWRSNIRRRISKYVVWSFRHSPRWSSMVYTQWRNSKDFIRICSQSERLSYWKNANTVRLCIPGTCVIIAINHIFCHICKWNGTKNIHVPFDHFSDPRSRVVQKTCIWIRHESHRQGKSFNEKQHNIKKTQRLLWSCGYQMRTPCPHHNKWYMLNACKTSCKVDGCHQYEVSS